MTGVIWLAGLTVAVGIFLFNAPAPDGSDEYRRGDSKIYVREAEKWGGKGELFFEDLNQTIASFWHGRRLAFTTLVVTGIVSFTYRFFAGPAPTSRQE